MLHNIDNTTKVSAIEMNLQLLECLSFSLGAHFLPGMNPGFKIGKDPAQAHPTNEIQLKHI